MTTLRTLASAVAGVVVTAGLVGCQPEKPDVIPSSAQVWASGTGSLHYVAPDDGMLYVYDQADQRLLWSGNVSKGQSVDVDPQKNQIMVAGRVATTNNLNPSAKNQIYFEASPAPAMAPTPAPMPTPVPTPAPTPQSMAPTPSGNSGRSFNDGFIVTPQVNVQPNGTGGAVQVQPGLNLTPATQPAMPTTAPSSPALPSD